MSTIAVPSFDIFKRSRAVVYLLVLLSVCGFSYAEGRPQLFVLTLAATIVSWVLVEGPRGKPLPRFVVNLGVLATSMYLFYELVFSGNEGGPNLLLALGHFMTGILICKLFDQKTNRDYVQMLTLTLLIMVAGAVFSASLTFASILVGYLALGLYAILLLHLRAETEVALYAELAPSERMVLSDAFIRRDIRRVANSSMFLLVVVAIAVFLAVPRTRGQGILNGWSAGATMRTGFSNRVQFYDYTHLQKSDAVVMEVKLTEDGTNMGSEYYQPYFRGMVLDTYDTVNRQWVRATHDDPHPESVDSEVPLKTLNADKVSPLGRITQDYTLRAYSGNCLFSVGTPIQVTTDSPLKLGFEPRGQELIPSTQVNLPLRYHVVSTIMSTPTYKGEPPFLPRGDLGPTGHYSFGFPEHNWVPTEVRKLAEKLVADILPPGKAIKADQIRPVADRFMAYLRQYPYNLSFAQKDPTMDPTADFLFNRKDTGGHCEYFASAMVMLCRSVGINARMVIGYRGGEYNSIGGYYIVRQKDAHAWTEIYFPDHGWFTYDPSPSDREVGEASIVGHWFRDMIEVVQRLWLSTIVAFDNSSRSYIFESLRNLAAGITEMVQAKAKDFSEAFQQLLFSKNSPWSQRLVGAGSTLFILVMAAWLTYRWHWRRTSPIGHILRHADPRIQRQLAYDLIFFDELLRVLARTGIRKTAEQTPREYIEALAPALRSAAADARWLVSTFYDVRFGTTRVTGPLRTQIATALVHVRHELQHRPT